MTSIGQEGGMLPLPTSRLPTRIAHVLDLPYRTGKPHIYRRDGRWWRMTTGGVGPVDWMEPRRRV